MKIETRFDVDDHVWAAHAERVTETYTCPDCLGSLEEIVVTAGRETFATPCSACTYGYETRGWLTSARHVGIPQRLTIDSVRLNDLDPGEQYMCKETGVGSGTVWRSEKLFSDEDDAQMGSDLLAFEMEDDQVQRQEEHRARRGKEARHRPDYWKKRWRELDRDVKALRKELGL